MRNKIKFRIVIFAVMLMLFCLGFAGCASCENDNPPNGTIPDGEKPAEENKERKAGGGKNICSRTMRVMRIPLPRYLFRMTARF